MRSMLSSLLTLGWVASWGHPAPPAVSPAAPPPIAVAVESLLAADAPELLPPLTTPAVAWAAALAPLHVVNANTGGETRLKLYTAAGAVDPDAVDAFEHTVAQIGQDAHPIAPRVVQLAVKAAEHFDVTELLVVPAYRPKGQGKHATGEALDFKLPGVRAATLAAYLRSLAHVGVGIYTHPKTQYVHLDVRDESFHWLDASPPGRTWRERRLADPHAAERDGAWTPESDLPAAASVASASLAP